MTRLEETLRTLRLSSVFALLLAIAPQHVAAQTFHGMFYDKNQTVSAQHTFNPTVAGAPYVYGANVQVQPLPLGTPGALPSPNALGRMMQMGSGSAVGAGAFDNGTTWNCEAALSQKIAIVSCPPWNAVAGASDSTTGVQSALNSGLATIFFPDGVWNFNATIPSTVHRITGAKGAVLTQKVLSTDILKGTNLTDLTVEGLFFQCIAADAFVGGNNAVEVTSASGTSGVPGDSKGIRVLNNHFKNCQHRTVYIAYVDDFRVENNTFDGVSTGPGIFSSTNGTVAHNRMNQPQYSGASTPFKTDTETNTPSGTQHNARITFEDNEITDATFGQAILLHDCVQCRVIGNKLLNVLQGIYAAPVVGGTQLVQYPAIIGNIVVLETSVQHLGNSQYGVGMSGDGGNILTSPLVMGNQIVNANGANLEANVGAIMISGATDGAVIGPNSIATPYGDGITVNGSTANTKLAIHENNVGTVTAVGGAANCYHVINAGNTGDISKNNCESSLVGTRLEGVNLANLVVTDNSNGASVTTPFSSGATITLTGYKTVSAHHQSSMIFDNALSSLGTLDIGSTGQLHVAADGSITDAGALQFTASSGRLGVRQLAPSGALHVTDAATRAILDVLAVRISNNGGNPLLEFVDQGSGTVKKGTSNAANYGWQVSGVEKLALDSTGFLSVGAPGSVATAGNGDIVTPTSKALRSANNAGTNTFQMVASNASDQVVLSPDGNDIKWGKALVSLGGGAAPTLGTIGGSGPAAAAQNSWMRVIDASGAAFWVPVWK